MKHFHDNLHGLVNLDYALQKIVDTPEFQRLRFLKQLGFCFFVFPNANHTRFEHSLGVYYLANKMIHHLKRKQPELEITRSEVRCVQVAALLHDVGHGPFSHAFESVTGEKHETTTVKLVSSLLERSGYQPADIKTVTSMICPSAVSTDHKRYFLYQIVSNCETGVDVDRWDYLLRDSLNLSLGCTFDYRRLLEHTRVIGGKLCYHEKTVTEVREMLKMRRLLFEKVYLHKTVVGLELMFQTIAKTFLKQLPTVETSCLDDSLLQQMRFSQDPTVSNTAERFFRRELCRCVYEHKHVTESEYVVLRVLEKIISSNLSHLSCRFTGGNKLPLKIPTYSPQRKETVNFELVQGNSLSFRIYLC